jgi:hypothetical protein
MSSQPTTLCSLRVWLLDHSFIDVSVKQDSVVGDVVGEAMRVLGMNESLQGVLRGCFSLRVWGVTDATAVAAVLGSPLAPFSHVQDAFVGTRDGSRLVLSLRLLTPGVLGAAARDSAVARLIFVTAAVSVLSGTVIVTPEIALDLGALLLRARDENPIVGLLRKPEVLNSLLPRSVINRFAPEALEEGLITRFSALPLKSTLTPFDAAAAYCAIIEPLDSFCLIEVANARQRWSSAMPSDIRFCVNADGVVVFEENGGERLLWRASLSSLESWHAAPPTRDEPDGALILHVTVESNGKGGGGQATRLLFATASAPILAEALNDSAAQLLRELIEEEARGKKRKSPVPAAAVPNL